MIDATIDSVSMQKLCRAPALKVKDTPLSSPILGLQLIGQALREKRLVLYLDKSMGLRDEWTKTCNIDLIRTIFVKWMDLKGIRLCDPVAVRIPAALSKTLLNANFTDTGDKLLVRIGLAAIAEQGIDSFVIATTDGDFWDPAKSSETGNKKAIVAGELAKYGIKSTLLKDFLFSIQAI